MSDNMLFTCRVCGVEVGTHPFTINERGEEVGSQGICEKHCEDHEFEYVRGERRHECKHCGAEPPDDWYYCDDDIGVGLSFSDDGPIGWPASSMNGNAAERHKDPAAWERWVAFCNACGLP